MLEKRPLQMPLEFYVGEPTREPLRTIGGTPLPKVVAVWIPRQFLTSSGADVEAFVADVNDKIAERRGYVLWDGQILTTALTLGDSIDLVFEGDHPFDAPPFRQWKRQHREYFRIKCPYQMAEDQLDYTYSHIMARVLEPYLFAEERIAAVLSGRKDNYYFYCPCHSADVVYTTASRLVCMGCGAMHAVFPRPLSISPKQLLTAQEWIDFFDENGDRREEEISLKIVDFQEVESLETLWETNQWEEAKDEFIFFARSSAEVIEEAIRNTERDPSVFLEAGWTPVVLPPPPAHQVTDNSIDIDLAENAAHSLREGVASYVAARKISDRLVNAIPQLFRAAELLLKSKLQEIDPRGLKGRPDNPTVLKHLAAGGISLSASELRNVGRLRRIRNDLQHGTAKLNYRVGLSVCRQTIVFLDRFVQSELGLWLGDVVPPDDWYQLLAIPEVAANAECVVSKLLESIRQQPCAIVCGCPRCHRDTLVRPDARAGASCVRCGHIPGQSPKQKK